MANDFDIASLTPDQQQVLLSGPALTPPLGVLPQFDNPPNKTALGAGLIIACAAFCVFVVAVRIYAKAVCSRKMEAEDYLALAALACYGGFLYFSYEILYMAGLYVHQWDVRLRDLSKIIYNVNNSYLLYGNIIMFLKAGILFQYIHLFAPLPSIHPTFRHICHATIVANVLFYVACTIVENFSCTPREKIWNKLIPGHCINNPALIMSSGVLNLMSDVLVFALPQRMVWGLRVSWGKRVGVALVFGVGVFGCICGAFRLVSTINALNSDDMVFMVGPIGLWSHGEITAGFLILCVPCMPKVVKNSPLFSKCLSGCGRGDSKINSRHGLPSWYRNATPRKMEEGANGLDVDRSFADKGRVDSGASVETYGEGESAKTAEIRYHAF